MTNETKSKRGGEGRGQGRKPLTPTEPTVKVAITLLASQVEAMQQLGNGNLSAGIRKAIDTMNRTKQVTLKFVAQSGHTWEESVDASDIDSTIEQTVSTHGDIERVEKLADPNNISGDTIWRME